jgi:hypothetical protein
MFIQVIQGKVQDEAGLRRALERWTEELQPGAAGYLGTTAGFTEDGTFIALARFESAEAAQANNDRPEQGEWWSEAEKNFDGPVDFLDCADAGTWLDGGSDDAGFVQIMRGRSADVARMHELMGRHTAELREGRPEIIGGLLLDGGDGRWVNAIYFESEEAARAGEQKEPPEHVKATREEGMSLADDVSFFDLKDPILISP